MTHDPDEQVPTPAEPRHGRDLTVGSIPRLLIVFSLPMLIGNVLQFAYSFVNAIWVGHYLPTAAQAAIANSFPVIFVIIPIAAGLTTASNILVAQYIGAKNLTGVREVVSTSVVLVGGLSIALAALGWFYIPDLLRLMGAPPEVATLATGYLRIFMFTMPFAFAFFLLASLLRGVGDSTTPLWFQAVTVIINGVLDPILIRGLLGAPRLGLNGAAIASVIAQIIAVVALIIFLQARRHIVTPDWSRLRVHGATALLLLKIGIPAAVQQMLVSLGLFFVTGFVNSFGKTVIAAFGFAGRIDQLAFFPAMSLNIAVTSLAGQNIGACKFARVRQLFWWGILLSGGITILVSLVAVGVPGILLRIFTSNAAVIAEGEKYLRIVGASYIFFAIMFISHGIINGAGHTLATTIISLISVWGVRVWLAGYLSRRLESEIGIWYALSISFAVAMLLSLGYYFSGRWKKPISHQSSAELAGATPCEETPPSLEGHPPLDTPEKSG